MFYQKLKTLLHRPVFRTRRAAPGSSIRSLTLSKPSETVDLRHQILCAITQLGDEVPKQKGLAVILDMVTTHLINLTGASSTFVHLVTEDKELLELVSIAGQPVAKLGQRLQKGQGMAGNVWQNAHSLYVDDYGKFAGRLSSVQGNITQACALPMTVDGKVFGVLGLMFSEDCDSIEAHLELLQQYTNLAGIAILNAKLIHQTREELEQTRCLIKLSAHTAASQSLDSLFEVSAENLLNHFGCTKVDLWALEGSSITHSLGAWEKQGGQTQRLSETELQGQRQSLFRLVCGKAGLTHSMSNLSFVSLSYFELANCQQSAENVFLLLDDGEPWVLLRTSFAGQSGSMGVLGNLLRSAISHISLSARIHRVLNDAKFRAEHDELTGLPNRFKLHQYLQANTGQMVDSGQSIALFFIDLDGFKEVNDTLGHAAGDQLLVKTAARFESAAGGEAFISRQGGDEFALVSMGRDRMQCEKVASGLLLALQPPFQLEETVRIGASIGICLVDGSRYSAAEILQRADKAMYKAKNSGKNRFAFCSNSLSHYSLELAEYGSPARKAG